MFSHIRTNQPLVPSNPMRSSSLKGSNGWNGSNALTVGAAMSITIALSGANVHAHVPNINDHTSVIPFVIDGGTGDSQSSTGSSTSADGRYVVFSSLAGDLVPVDNNGGEDVFLFDRQTGVLRLMSRAPDGSSGNAPSTAPTISADGGTIAFTTQATNLYDDSNGGVQDVVIYDRRAKTLAVANRNDPGEQSEFAAGNPALSADGRYVAFDSASALVAEGVNGSRGIYVRDLWNNTTQLLSRTPAGEFPNAESTDPAISADGSRIAYVSRASNIVAGAADVANIYYVNRNSLVTELVTKTANADSYAPALSGDGAVVGFHSEATSLGDLDFNSASDAFIWTAANDTVELISRQPSGESASGSSFDVSLNEDGNLVLYRSLAPNIVAGDSNGLGDVFLRNRAEFSNTRINVAEDGTQADGEAFNPGLSADGNTVVFWSYATTLSDDHATNHSDLFMRNLGNLVPQPQVVSAVLPSSRSAQVNQTATVFATMVADEIGNNCRVELASPIDATIWYQRTDPQTNALIGERNVPVYMRPNVPMSLAVGITAFSPIEPQEVQFAFVCDTGLPAPVLLTTNTVFFSATENQVPDIVALAATINNDGIVRIPDDENFGVFSAANVNLGAPGNITASIVVLGADLDEALLCPTIFETGVCTEAPSGSTAEFLGSNGTASFGLFVRSSGTVPFLPEQNRVVLIFTDDNGVIRGRTSVAVTKP